MADLNSKRSGSRLPRLMCLAAAVLSITTAAWLYGAPPDGNQRTFANPQEAIEATVQASEQNDVVGLRQIFGPDSKDIVESGDPAADKADRAEFVRLAHEKIAVNQDPTNPDRASFSIGEQDWPFPVPLERNHGKWMFNAASGKMEILAHRIGENELNVIDVCRGFVEAQLDYASKTHDGAPVLEYAQKILSSPGKRDGLYLDGADGVAQSFAVAAASGQPYGGYYFRILKAQGPAAVGGAFNYVVNGKMIGGFAMVAWPAEYGVSGIKTFIVNHNGAVFEKDLGPDTMNRAKLMTQFNPDSSWHGVELE